jgi:hypothetical protein
MEACWSLLSEKVETSKWRHLCFWAVRARAPHAPPNRTAHAPGRNLTPRASPGWG